MTTSRTAELMPHLGAAVERGARCYVITKSRDDRSNRDLEGYRRIEEHLAAIGVKVIHKPGMHEKLVFIDDQIAWAGSLNVLSFRNTQEWMARWDSREVVKDFTRPLGLDRVLSLYEAEEARCPICGSDLVPAEGLSGLYWRCEVKGCYTQDLDKPVPRDGILRCATHGCDGGVEFYDGGQKPVWRCTANKRHRQHFHPNHLRLPKMRELIAQAVGVRGLRKLTQQQGLELEVSDRPEPESGPLGADAPPVVTAVDLARRLRQDPRTFRAWLRSQARAGHPIVAGHRLNDPWEFTSAEADQLALEFIDR